MSDAMSRAEDAYLTPPDPQPECPSCGGRFVEGLCVLCGEPEEEIA